MSAWSPLQVIRVRGERTVLRRLLRRIRRLACALSHHQWARERDDVDPWGNQYVHCRRCGEWA
jgi:hypothetical protein